MLRRVATAARAAPPRLPSAAPARVIACCGVADAYSVLGVAPGATVREITRAFRERSKLVHPDTAPTGGGDVGKFRALVDAKNALLQGGSIFGDAADRFGAHGFAAAAEEADFMAPVDENVVMYDPVWFKPRRP